MEDRGPGGAFAALRRHDRDRWLLCLLAPEARRVELFALYGVNLEIARTPEVVSSPILGQIRLQWWREAVDALAAGGPARHQVLAPLGSALAEGRLDRALLQAVIDARESDLEEEPPSALADLELHAAATSGALLRLHLGLLGVTAPAALAAGEEIGTAWALLGLMRALPHARAPGPRSGGHRLWLPRQTMREAGLAEGSIAPGAAGLAEAVRVVAERAAALLAASRRRRAAVPRPARAPLALARLADRHLTALRQAGWDPFALDPRPSGLAPLRLAAAAMTGRY